MVPASPASSSSSSSRTRPPSISLPSFPSFTPNEQPFPSPAYEAIFVHDESSSPAPPYQQHDEYQPYYYEVEEDMDLEAAFAGDAFASMQVKEKEDPWARFHGDTKTPAGFGSFQPIQPAFQSVQPAFQVQPSPVYNQRSDEDAAEAMITDQ